MVSILITGAAGFIGSSLAKKLLSKKYKILIVDNLVTGKIENIPENKNCKFINYDINNPNIVKKLKNYKLDYIFHFAACVGVERTLKNPLIVL